MSSRFAGKFGVGSMRLQPAEADEPGDHPVGHDDEVPLGGKTRSERPGQLRREEGLVPVDGLDVVDLDPGLLREPHEGREAVRRLVDVHVALPVREPEGSGRGGQAGDGLSARLGAGGRCRRRARARRHGRRRCQGGAARRGWIRALPGGGGEEGPEADRRDGECAADDEPSARDAGRGRGHGRAARGEDARDRQVGWRLPAGFDGERMGRREDQPDLFARLPQLGAGRALDVLLVDGHRAAAARFDDVARRDAEVRDVADGAEQLVDAIGDGIGQLEQPDLLRTDADLVAGQALGQGSRDPDRGPVRELGDGEVAVDALRGRRQEVADAEEPCDEPGPRTFVQAGRIAQLLVPAVVHDRDAIGHRHRFFLVVGHEDERDPDLLLDPLQLDLHLLAQLQVEGPERFVEQQHRRPVDERPGERDALGLSARQLGRLAPLVARAARRA